MIRLVILVIFLLPAISSAALFGPDSYEECMNDGKVGRTNAELNMLRNYCRSKFLQKNEENKFEGVLSKTFRNGEGNLRCIIFAETLKFNINKTAVTYRGQSANVILKDSDKIVFKLKKIVRLSNKTIADGLFTIYKNGVIYQQLYETDTNNFESYANGECVEY